MNLVTFQEFLKYRGKEQLIDFIKDSFKNNKSMPFHTLAIELYNDYVLTGGYPNAIINYKNSEDYNLLIHKIKNSLSKVEYEIFELLIRDFGWKDISEILNLEPKQVDNGRERIKRKIRKLLENETD